MGFPKRQLKSPRRRKAPNAAQVSATLCYGAMAEVAQLVRSPDLPQENVRRRVKHLCELLATSIRATDGKLRSLFDNRTWRGCKELCPNNGFILDGKDPTRLADEITLHVGGEKSTAAVLRHIRNSKKSIEMWMFVWVDDDTGNEVASALLDAANRGVKVMIRKDQCGVMFERGVSPGHSFFHKDAIRIRDAFGATLMRWGYPGGTRKRVRQKSNATAAALLQHPNVRIERRPRYDHSKVYLFDDETVILGGVNISNVSRHEFHDYMVEIRSALLVGRFQERISGRECLDLPLGATVDFFFNVVRQPKGKKLEVAAIMQHLLDSAQHEVIIQMAYFGDERLTNAIVAAANRGVQVAILTSEHPDVQHDLNYAILRDILRRSPPQSVRVYLSRLTHAKLIHVDRSRTFLGSANMNTTGTIKLGESNIYVNDGDGSLDSPQSQFTIELRVQLLRDMHESQRIVSPNQLKVKKIKAWLESHVAA
jgi:cardiolipin synthase